MFLALKYRVAAVFMAIFSILSVNLVAQHNEGQTPPSEAEAKANAHHAEKEGGFSLKNELFSHIMDSHDWHIFSVGEGEHAFHATVPLPVIVYTASKGLNIFSSSRFHHGHESYNGFTLNKVGTTKTDANGKVVERMAEEITAEGGEKVWDFSITKNILCMFISMALLIWIALAAAKGSKQNGATKAPKGLQNVLEPIITFIRDNVAKPFLGSKWANYMPLLLTFFFFIWINNLLGLLPLGFNLTGNIAVTAMLALIFFVVMLFKSNKYFWGHIFNPPGVPLGIKFILVPIEFISIFIKPVALALRLFANIFAGHTIIICIISLIFIMASKFGSGAGIGSMFISIPFTIFMFFIELLVAAIQAFIFTNLAAVFIGQATEEHHHTHEEGHAVAH
jgi:F-type H+-transporting ATPase subunit a